MKITLPLLLLVYAVIALMPEREAEARVILYPAFAGMVASLLGIYSHETVLIAVDGDGRVSEDALERGLAKKYAFIEDREVITGLATAISAKADLAPPNRGRKVVALTRDELIQILEPSGLGELKPAEVKELMSDLM